MNAGQAAFREMPDRVPRGGRWVHVLGWRVPVSRGPTSNPRSTSRGHEATCTELTPHAVTNFEVIARFLPVGFTTLGHPGAWEVQVKAL